MRSRAALVAAMTALLDEVDLEQISITQVVRAAGVTRPTFYQHFTDLAQLASDAAIARLDAEFSRHDDVRVADRVPQSSSLEAWLSALEPIVHELLEHLAEHGDFYRRVFNGPSTRQLIDAGVGLLARRILQHSPLGAAVAEPQAEETRDKIAIISGGIVWLICTWLATDLTGRDSIAAMTKRISLQLVTLSLAGRAATVREPTSPTP